MGSPDAVTIRYEKLLVIRLIEVVKVLQSEAPGLCAASGFLDSWSAVEQLPTGVLFQAAHQPLLDVWVGTSERLVSIGAHKRYPHVHPLRHLKDFARLLLSWSDAAPDGMEGKVALLGRKVTPLLFGRLLLITGDRLAYGTLIWRIANRVLQIELHGTGIIAEVSLSNPAEKSSLSSCCSLFEPPGVNGIILDLWTPEYIGDCDVSAALVSLQRQLEQTTANLTPEQRSVVTTFCRCVTLSPIELGWAAGLIRLPGQSSDITPENLVELAYCDRIKRLLRTVPIHLGSISTNIGGTFDAMLIELGARRAALRLFGKEIDSRDACRWEATVSNLLMSPVGVRLLREMGEDVAPYVALTAPSTPSRLFLADVIKRAGIENIPAPKLELWKTRCAETNPTDWVALDSLINLTQAELVGIYETAIDESTTSEANTYCAAMCSYLLGRFEACQKVLLRCLQHDNDVEEYWQLLAFTLRHLGQYAEFERIIFGREREISTVRSPLRAIQQASPSSEAS